ncbi:hypothetical protein MKZ38_008620 [Zalerion maritima]|uniref:Cupin type-2 domain-containing protein n=1 Tax=Zalerion maritima TaxID=339359 RepID=A0AAD5RZN8_9PEZI|nr:hypothetical protein MKZ38_008620 [Zalerion maritima]
MADFPPPKRFITTHDADGKAIFSSELSEELPSKVIGAGDKFYLGYTSSKFPVNLSGDQDIKEYGAYLKDLPGITIPGGTVLRFVDIVPGATSPMHRTVSLDYGVVVEGEIDLILDSGEVRRMKRGDVAIQRGTMHAWRNASQTEWGRMMYVLQEAESLEIGGGKLTEDYGVGMDGVKPSSS